MSDQRKQNQDEVPNVRREGWNANEIHAESVNKPADETLREITRGDETKGDADNRDIAGGADRDDTPQGREENKNRQIGSEL